MKDNKDSPSNGYALNTVRRHWNSYAHKWKYVGPPLRPSAEDLLIMQEAVANQYSQNPDRELKALLLGITSEIAEMDWPKGTQLIAVERSKEMIQTSWPGDIPGVRRAQLGDWLNLTQEDDSLDVVIGDGSFNCLVFPQGFQEMSYVARRILRVQGKLIVRFFVLPEKHETADDIFRDLKKGNIGNFHIFKFRLVMAMQPEPEIGVRLGDVWRIWDESGIDAHQLSDETGWGIETIDTINIYKDKDTHLTFPQLDQVLTVIPDCFKQVHLSVPNYEMGERCPTIVFQLVN